MRLKKKCGGIWWDFGFCFENKKGFLEGCEFKSGVLGFLIVLFCCI